MDRSIDERMDGWMTRMVGLIERMDGWMDGWMDG